MVDGMAGDKPAVYIISLLPHQHIVYLYVIRIDSAFSQDMFVVRS